MSGWTRRIMWDVPDRPRLEASPGFLLLLGALYWLDEGTGLLPWGLLACTAHEFGQYLKITHTNGVSSFYAHCSKLLVRKGETVTCGQTVALVGHTGMATGSHLHFTIEKDNVRLDPAYYVELS